MSTVELPGLDRLLEVVNKHGVPIETLPAGPCRHALAIDCMGCQWTRC